MGEWVGRGGWMDGGAGWWTGQGLGGPADGRKGRRWGRAYVPRPAGRERERGCVCAEAGWERERERVDGEPGPRSSTADSPRSPPSHLVRDPHGRFTRGWPEGGVGHVSACQHPVSNLEHILRGERVGAGQTFTDVVALVAHERLEVFLRALQSDRDVFEVEVLLKEREFAKARGEAQVVVVEDVRFRLVDLLERERCGRPKSENG